MTYFSSYAEPAEGFAVAAGREHGLRRLVLAAGRLGPGRADMPRSRRPPVGFDWTSDERMAEVVDRGFAPGPID